MSLIRWFGQMCLALVFIKGGYDAFMQPGSRPEKAARLGIPEPELAVTLNGAAMALAGTALALDLAPRLSAFVLLGSLVPTTVAGHAFWVEETPAGRRAQVTQFLKNLGLVGGLLAIISHGSHQRR